MVSGRKIIPLALLILATFFLVKPVFASTTDGTISTGNAWSTKIGWLNFASTNGNVRVTDAALTGHVWSSLYGWIKLNPANSGVTNNSEGVLSGSAWGENIGWIDFSGVTISSAGVFSGAASGTNTGSVNFSCTNCLVQTDWRPASSRVVPVGGTTLPPAAGSPPVAPYFIILNNGAPQTNSSTIIITLRGSADTSYAWVAEDSLFNINPTRVDFSPAVTEVSIPFVLSSGEGQKTIYAKFCNQWGTCSGLISNSIIYTAVIAPPVAPISPPLPISPPPPTTTIGQIIGQVKGVVGQILSRIFPVKVITAPLAKLYSEAKLWFPYWFKAPPVEQIPVERFVSRKTPFAFRGKWNYLDPKPINRFVFAPLPKEFLALTNKFPQLKNILQQVGINRLSDVEKLKSVQMYLPSLTRAVTFSAPQITSGQIGGQTTTLPSGQILAGQFAEQNAIPIGDLTPNLKDKIPTDVVFARSAGQLVDFKIALSLTAKNRPEQKISTISGKTLSLTVRPEFPAKRVRGFLVFRSKSPQARAEMPLASLVNSLIFAQPAFAFTQEQPVEVEEKLVLLEFEYTDPDGDGIYNAEIQAPIPAGEYEIITVIDYVDPEMGIKQIRLITVIDPEGYVFEKVGNKELRIPGAVATLYHFNPEIKAYEVWPAADFQQDNPQVTGLSGSYSFLVPGGTYSIKIEAPGYLTYEGKPFIVEEGNGVHTNIELKAQYWWLKILDWKTALLILVAMLLLWNFYKDRRREKRA